MELAHKVERYSKYSMTYLLISGYMMGSPTRERAQCFTSSGQPTTQYLGSVLQTTGSCARSSQYTSAPEPSTFHPTPIDSRKASKEQQEKRK